MTVNDFMKKFGHTQDISLTLANERGETYTCDTLETLTHMNDRIKARWAATEPFTHAIPLDYAIIHRGDKVWASFAITPVNNSVVGTSIEVVYAG